MCAYHVEVQVPQRRHVTNVWWEGRQFVVAEVQFAQLRQVHDLSWKFLFADECHKSLEEKTNSEEERNRFNDRDISIERKRERERLSYSCLMH